MKETLTIAAGLMLIALYISKRGPDEKEIGYLIEPLHETGSPQFMRAMGSLLGPPVLEGNRITELQNGEEIFPAMLDAISKAQRTISFETFIYWSGEVGDKFSKALIERAEAGVKVHVLLDWVGCGKMDKDSLEAMKNAGVEVEYYRPLRWYNLSRLNNRTHRKLLVVDGKVGFTGGVGIADKWLGHAQDPEHWRDSHYRIEGPAVAQMQSAFLDNWIKTRSKVLHGDDYFPALEKIGGSRAQVFRSSSREGSESVRLMYLLSIASARKTLRIASSYFIPDDLTIKSLIKAKKRGVQVEIIVPGTKIDVEMSRKASRSLWGKLLEADIHIYEYQPTMFHCKVFIADDRWVSVGSTNFDNRSFRLNDEANLNILDEDFAKRQAAIFENDKTKSKRITLEEWKRRPWKERIPEALARIFRYQL